jgi:hypothetical protein
MRCFQGLSVALIAAALAGCGSAGAPTAAPELLNDVANTPVVSAPEAVAEPVEAPAELVPAPTVRAEGDVSAANILDPWRPMGLRVSHTDHDAITLTWRTELESRAVIYFGKSSSPNYTFVQADDTKRKSHTVRVDGLSRYTKYRFVVVGLGPVGMQFPSEPLEQRTRLLF